MSIDSAIAHFRVRQAEQFTTTVIVKRPDPATFTPAGGYQRDETTVYEGGCKIRPAGQQGAAPQAGEREVGIPDFYGKFPVDTELLRGDEITVTASAHDARLVDSRFRVTFALPDEWQIAAVFALEQISPIAEQETGS